MESQKTKSSNLLIVIAILAVIYLIYIAAQPTYVPTGGAGIESEAMQTWLQEIDVVEDDFLKARTLREMCESEDIGEEGYCYGYMQGFLESHLMSSDSFICDDSGLRQSDQIIQALNNFMDDNPQHWEKYRAAVFAAAIHDSFSCNAATSP